MPRGDGTGPEGKGSKTGRGQGDCNPKKPRNTTGQGSSRRVPRNRRRDRSK